MLLLHSMDALRPGLRFVVVLGMFDGLHLGHQRILSITVRNARAEGAEAVLLTFDPHPEAVLRGSRPPLLCDPAERLARFEQAGIGTTVVHPFDRQFASQSAEEFLRRLSMGRDLAGLVITPETAFGRDRSGTTAVIEQLAPTIGYRVIHLPQQHSRGAPISSSRLREQLAAGALDEVRRMLGRSYAVVGELAEGERSLAGAVVDRIHQTVWLVLRAELALPPEGAYAVRAWPISVGLLKPSLRLTGTATVEPQSAGEGVRGVRLSLSAGALERAGRGTSSGRWRVEFLHPS